MSNVGILLAAGAGSRMGWPKALTHADDGSSWLATAIERLLDGGCDHVIVVLGAQADRARELVPSGRPVRVVVADDWSEGMSASLRAGFAAARETESEPGEAPTEEARVAVITLVDLPGLPVEAVARLLDGADTATLRQAVFGERPGHPVVVGREHWDALAASGARRHGSPRVPAGALRRAGGLLRPLVGPRRRRPRLTCGRVLSRTRRRVPSGHDTMPRTRHDTTTLRRALPGAPPPDRPRAALYSS